MFHRVKTSSIYLFTEAFLPKKERAFFTEAFQLSRIIAIYSSLRGPLVFVVCNTKQQLRKPKTIKPWRWKGLSFFIRL